MGAILSLPAPPSIDLARPTVLPPSSRTESYLLPGFLILYGLVRLPSTFFTLLTTSPRSLFSLGDHLFTRVWSDIAAVEAAEFAPEKHELISGARGTVLEVGPGLGAWVGSYDWEKVDKVFGVEPNTTMHEALNANVKELGLEGRYVVVGCGVQDQEGLRKAGVPEQVDTICSIQVLCSVPRPEKILPALHNRLREGGELRIFEHIKSKDGWTKVVQRVYDTVWHIPFGGCSLCQDTDVRLQDRKYMGFSDGEGEGKVGWEGWDKAEFTKVKGEMRWSCLPVVSGRLVKH